MTASHRVTVCYPLVELSVNADDARTTCNLITAHSAHTRACVRPHHRCRGMHWLAEQCVWVLYDSVLWSRTGQAEARRRQRPCSCQSLPNTLHAA